MRPGLTLTWVHRNFNVNHDMELMVSIVRTTDSETTFASEFKEEVGKNLPRFEDHMSRREFLRARNVDYGRGGHVAGFPEHRPHTLFMLSQRLLTALKTDGEAELIVPVIMFPPGGGPSDQDFLVKGQARVVPPVPETLDLLVDGQVRHFPTVHVRGDFERVMQHIAIHADFWFLDDTAAAWVVRNDARDENDSTFHMVLGSVVTNNAPRAIEQQLAESCRAPVYGFYFPFNSAEVQPSSAPTFQAVADMLQRHGDWILTVEGHTDSIGNSEANRKLSERRAGAVKDELVTRYGVAPARLTAAGLGAGGAVAPNRTLEGRARNRRVDLVRRCGR